MSLDRLRLTGNAPRSRMKVPSVKSVSAPVLLCLLSLLACKSTQDSAENTDDPVTVDCSTPVKVSCLVNDTCHAFFTENSTQQIVSDCQKLGGVATASACPSTFTQCCLQQQSSYDEPEAICISDSNPSAGQFRSACRDLAGASYCSAQ